MRYYYSLSFTKLKLKATKDEKLINNEIFQESFKNFEDHFKHIEHRAMEIEGEIRKKRFLKTEELHNIRDMVERLENENQKDLRTLKRMINLVANNMQIRFMKGHFQAI